MGTDPTAGLGLGTTGRGQRGVNVGLTGLPPTRVQSPSDVFGSKLLAWWPHLAPVAADEAGAGALGPIDIPERARRGAHHAHVHAAVEDGTHDGPVQGQLPLHEHGARPGE